MLLELEAVSKKFGGLHAIEDLDLNVAKGEILGLIGPNGAGKTTVFNLITGFFKPDSGVIRFEGDKINGLRPDEVCKKGISRTFQVPRPFANLTVLQNISIALLYSAYVKGQEQAKEGRRILEFVGLQGREHTISESLNIVEKKLLDLARALASRPKLLLMDEVTAGLPPSGATYIMDLVHKIRDMGTTIVIIEHVMKVIWGVTDRIAVLHYGKKIAEGTPNQMAENDKVIHAYLGISHAHS